MDKNVVMKVLGIGNAIIDVICKVDDDFIIKNNLTKGTMKLVFDKSEFTSLLSKLKNSKNPSVFFESGKRIEKLFDVFQEEFNPSMNILVAREMTKIHETFYRGKVGTIKDKILETDHGLKGEFVIVLDHSSQSQSSSFEGDELRVIEILTTYLDQKLALKIASELLDKSRNEIYKLKF